MTATELFLSDPSALLALAFGGADDDKKIIAALDAAIEALGIVDEPEYADRIRNVIWGIALRYRGTAAKGPETDAILAAVRGIMQACADIDAHLETLLAARMAAPTNKPDRADVLIALYPTIAALLLPSIEGFEWDEREGMQAPMRAEFRRIAERIMRSAPVQALGDLPTTTKPVPSAHDRAISELAQVYSDATGKEAKAYRKSEDQYYQPPFVRFVLAVWPAMHSPSPTIDQLSGALKRIQGIRAADQG